MLLNRTPISNEYREESPCAPRMRNAATRSPGRGLRSEGTLTGGPFRERYAVVIIFCYPLASPRVRIFGAVESERDQSRGARNGCLALIIFACFRVTAACAFI